MDAASCHQPNFVFVHGMIGFDSLGLRGRRVAYFRGVEQAYQALGVTACFPRVSNLGSVRRRAQDLAAFVESKRLEQVTLVGASMGGLDARYFTSHLDRDKRVRALVSIGTPHRGSPVADKVLSGRWPGRFFAPSAISDLATSSSEGFNLEVPDRDDVQYFSYAGIRPTEELPLWLRFAGRCVSDAEGVNDGLVSESSAIWGRYLGSVRADHFELIGWNLGTRDRGRDRPYDHLSLYRKIATDVLNTLKE